MPHEPARAVAVTAVGPRGGLHRIVAVLVTPSVAAAAPVGVDPVAFGLALVEDSYDIVAGLELVAPAVAVSEAGTGDGPGAGATGTGRPPGRHTAASRLGADEVAELVWPGTPVLRLSGAGTEGGARGAAGDAAPGRARGLVGQTLAALAGLGAEQGAVLAADAPDLPSLLIGKLFRALGDRVRRAEVAVCPAAGGGLVALAAWLPLADWAGAALRRPDAQDPLAELDVADITGRLRAAAPRRSAVQAVPGWHRLRSRADVDHLDRGLEGWPATRAILLGHR